MNPLLGNTSCLVYGAGPRKLLLDCGSTVPLKLFETGLMDEVTDLVLTHLHADHIGGMEILALYTFFIQGRRGDKRVTLHLATDSLAHNLWEHALRAGLEHNQDQDGKPLDANIETFFNIRVGTEIEVEGLPPLSLRPTLHVTNMENYAVHFDNGVFYSGDTVELPPHDYDLIFQDCQFGDGGPVHITYERLKTELPEDVKKKTHLLHLGVGHENHHPEEDGFAGLVLPGQEFTI